MGMNTVGMSIWDVEMVFLKVSSFWFTSLSQDIDAKDMFQEIQREVRVEWSRLDGVVLVGLADLTIKTCDLTKDERPMV